ncbi:MAG: OB-fold domain-containing protein [Thermodesulfobacteriota bacterium]|nr:OB-fold domain-containing protein [Thermodesulfobacteriota bacterium]
MMNMPGEERLTLLRCAGCGALHVPPKVLCPKCGHEVLLEHSASGLGNIYTFTTIWVAPEAFKKQVPYEIALVQLEEGIKVTARINKKPEETLQIGKPVKFLRKNNLGYWFEL